jgi:hypothetical protein
VATRRFTSATPPAKLAGFLSSSIRDSGPQEASREEAVAYSGEAIEHEAPRLSEGLDDSANISIALNLNA